MKNLNHLCWNTQRQTCVCTQVSQVVCNRKNIFLKFYLAKELYTWSKCVTASLIPNHQKQQNPCQFWTKCKKKSWANTCKQIPAQILHLSPSTSVSKKFNLGECLLEVWAWEVDHIQVEKCRTKTHKGGAVLCSDWEGVRGIILKWGQKKKTEGL